MSCRGATEESLRRSRRTGEIPPFGRNDDANFPPSSFLPFASWRLCVSLLLALDAGEGDALDERLL